MLNRIGHVHFASINAGRLQTLIQQLAGRPDKWSPLMIFAITGLFAHQKYRGTSIPFAKDNLRRMLIGGLFLQPDQPRKNRGRHTACGPYAAPGARRLPEN
jgi:hypothetical protein